jgi:hypothetical protein
MATAAVFPPALITYDGLPAASGGAHRIRIRNRRRVWHELQAFLSQFTTYDAPEAARLMLYEDQTIDELFLARARTAAGDLLGPSDRRHVVHGSTDVFRFDWPVDPSRIGAALDLIDGLEPLPRYWLGGPITLLIRARFRLIDPETREVFANQGSAVYGHQTDAGSLLGESSLGVFLGNPSTCGMFLSLPFPDVSEAAIAYIARLDAALPFRLSARHWARWQLDRSGTHYYKRHVAISVPGRSLRGIKKDPGDDLFSRGATP